MVSLYFGVPRSGKTTLLRFYALRADERKCYKNFYKCFFAKVLKFKGGDNNS